MTAFQPHKIEGVYCLSLTVLKITVTVYFAVLYWVLLVVNHQMRDKNNKIFSITIGKVSEPKSTENINILHFFKF